MLWRNTMVDSLQRYKTRAMLLSTLALLSTVAFLCIGATASAAPNLRGSGYVLNNGQWPAHVIAFAMGTDVNVWVTKSGMVFDHSGVNNGRRSGMVSSATWSNAQPQNTSIEVRNATSTPVNFFKNANNASTPYTHVATRLVSGFVVKNVYQGVDVEYRMEDKSVRFDIVAERAELASAVKLSFEGATWMRKIGSSAMEFIARDDAGHNVSSHMGGAATPSYIGFKNVRAFQNGKEVAASFTEDVQQNTVRFAGDFDPSQPLVIDPTVYGTYLGGPEDDVLAGVRTLATGEVAVVGTTSQIDYPAAIGKYAVANSGSSDGFLAVYDAALTTLKRYTFIGGDDPDSIKAFTADASDNIYVAGTTISPNFPITGGAAGQVYKGQIDAFASKFNAGLSTLVFSTFIGGNKDDIALGIAVDGDLSVIVCGGTNSTTSFPTNAGFKKTFGGLIDGFLTKISSSGASYVYSTYFGVEGTEEFSAVVVELSGSPIVTGFTTSSNFQTFPVPSMFNPNRRPFNRVFGGGITDAFITKFGQDGGTLIYSTYIGGLGDDEGKGIFVDDLGRAYLVGETTSTNLPATAGFKQAKIGGRDVFLFVLSDDGKENVGCTYYGGAGDDRVRSVTKDKTNAAVVGGRTASTDFQVEGAGTTGQRRGATDGYVAVFTVGALKYADLIGGSAADEVTSVFSDSNDDVYACGTTTSTDFAFPVDAAQRTIAGKVDGFVVKSAKGTIALTAPSGSEMWCIGTNQTVSWAATDMAVTDRYRIDVTTDDGATWIEVVTDLTAKSYSWKPQGVQPGNYRLRVTSSRGHATMTTSTFHLGPPAVITSQPSSTAVCLGAKAEFSLVATGETLRYKWRKDGTVIPTATSATLTIAAVTAADAGTYVGEVASTCGSAVFARPATLKVETNPTITMQPRTQSVEAGKPLLLSVTSSILGSRYQWKKNGTAIPGATANEYSRTAAVAEDSGSYTVTVVTDCGTIESSVAQVTVTPATSVREVWLSTGRVSLVGEMPVSEICQVLVEPADFTDVQIRVVDIQGATTSVPPVRLVNVGGSIIAELHCGTLAIGTYILDVRVGGRQAYLPFVVSR